MSAERLISLTIPYFSDKPCQKNYSDKSLYCKDFCQVANNFSDGLVRKIIVVTIGFISCFSMFSNFSDKMTLTPRSLAGEL